MSGSHETPNRGRLTDALLAFLNTVDEVTSLMVVGDQEVPAAAGWPDGTPQAGDFQASVVVRTGQATPLHRESISTRHSSWACRYGLDVTGATRTQTDACADVVRRAVTAYRETEVDGWKVQDAVFQSLGGIDPQGSQATSRTYKIADVVDLWVVRQRGTT